MESAWETDGELISGRLVTVVHSGGALKVVQNHHNIQKPLEQRQFNGPSRSYSLLSWHSDFSGQDAFRRLLQTPRPVVSTSSSGFTKSKANPKALDASQPAFKPRKVKKNAIEGQYRDRAAERREGLGGDYAQVEAVLEDFEKRSAGQDKSTLEAQRHYLGGDATHTILVKGLDMALLEQNRARAAMGADALADDESLEKAFAESQAQPKKRTREDLIRELKAKRAGQSPETTITEEQEEGKKEKTKEKEEARVLEEAKRAGKFRPIGFTPIGGEKKKKKAKDGEVEGEKRKKKKRRVDDAGTAEGTSKTPASAAAQAPEKTPVPVAECSKATTPPPQPSPVSAPEIEALPEDFDIFAGAGDYEGIQLDSDSEGEDKSQHPSIRDHEPEHDLGSAPNRKWIDTGSPEPEPEPEPSKPELLKSVLVSSSTTAAAPPPRTETGEGEDGGDEERLMRLVPLASSSLPSIKDFLAADEAASGSRKWRKRKGGGGERKGDAKEGGKKDNPSAKVERDYKRLKSYTDKKATT
ncbi:hypothetical protein C0995_006783 [Termitomyces sp. Mi166|nr:hypothetical protein C0995_006783 [Termitomyces sp. Mi166\